MAQDICQVVAPWYMAVRPARCVWLAEYDDFKQAPTRSIPSQTPVVVNIDGQKSHWQTLGDHDLPALCIGVGP